MFSVLRTRGILASVIVLATATILTACDDDEPGPDQEPAVQSMRLTVGTQSVTINAQGQCTGCPLVLHNGATVIATFLAANGEPDPVAVQGAGTAARYRVEVTIPNNTIGLAFTLNATQSFRGAIAATGVTATPLNLSFKLRDVQETEDEFGPFNVATTVVTPP